MGQTVLPAYNACSALFHPHLQMTLGFMNVQLWVLWRWGFQVRETLRARSYQQRGALTSVYHWTDGAANAVPGPRYGTLPPLVRCKLHRYEARLP